ncbi:MAG TPA: protein-disulfide reductase DsbD domain-containing protein [Devosiaceae bacterium]|nr:protein-disulfide reductase DsbD domain-containing protein [Devosiaceae bacterium]
MRLLLVILLVLASPVSAFAAATAWQDVAPGARLRLISSDVRQPDGSTLVGIELDIPQTLKTYWRLPGESGIPTEFDIAGSAGVSQASIEWPYPQPETSGGFLEYVYRGPTVLPIVLRTSGTPVLSARVTMGVCSDVCVPVRASFQLPLSFASADLGQSIRLQQAAALAPIAWDRSGSAFGDVTFDPKAHTLQVGLSDPAVDPASVIATADDPSLVFGMPQKSPDGRSIWLKLRGVDRGADWVGRSVQLTFMTVRGAYEVSERVSAP